MLIEYFRIISHRQFVAVRQNILFSILLAVILAVKQYLPTAVTGEDPYHYVAWSAILALPTYH